MPSINENQLPIKRTPLKGPAIDALESRKETNNNTPVDPAELRKSYEKVKSSLLDGLKALTRSAKA